MLQVSKALGPVATVIVRKGTLKPGDPIVVGTEHGRVRALRDSRNITLGNAGELMTPLITICNHDFTGHVIAIRTGILM